MPGCRKELVGQVDAGPVNISAGRISRWSAYFRNHAAQASVSKSRTRGLTALRAYPVGATTFVFEDRHRPDSKHEAPFTTSPVSRVRGRHRADTQPLPAGAQQLLDARQRQDAREDTIGVEILACKLPRRERMSGIVSLNRLEAPRRTLEVGIGEQPQAYRDMPSEAGILHHHGPPGGQVATASVAEPAALPDGTDRSHGRELASRSVYIPAI